MAVGLKTPVGVSIAGGAKIDDSPSEILNILRLALLPGDDENPFQNLGIDERIIFRVNDPSAHGLLRTQVRNIINKFSDRVALDPSVPISIRQTEEGKIELFFRFIDLETNEITDFNQVIE